MKARAYFQQAGDAPTIADAPCRRLGDPAENLQQSGFAGAVPADDANRLALLD